MKRIIAIGIMCIFLYFFSSCTSYENITFIENNGKKHLLYQGNEYYEVSIFSATEYYGIKNENDIELGWYYSFPFSTRFYSENSENPVFIYTIGGDTSMYLRQDYDYSTDAFVVEKTGTEIVWKDIFSIEKNDLHFSNPITVNLYSKQCPRIKISLEIAFIGAQWYVRFPNSQKVWIPSDEFMQILSDDGII